MQLDHLHAPFFVFIRKSASPSPSSLRDAKASPKVRGFGITEKHFGFARGSPFGRAAEQSEAERARMPTSKSWFICNYPMISASCRYTSSAPPLDSLIFTNWLFTMAVPSE